MPSTRRTTLAATTKSRKSIGVSRNNETNVQADHRTKTRSSTKKGRQSMMPRVPGEMASPLLKGTLSNGGRSANGTTPSRRKSSDKRLNIARDPRPISDKEHQLNCMRSLLQFLTEGGYDNTVTMRSLSRPSGKDFNQILTFLLRKIDLTFNDGSMKFEDEVVNIFRQLNYPYPMSKTSLVAAGSPHTWPTLLSALAWLVEYLKMHHSLESIADRLPDNENETEIDNLTQIINKSDKDFFQYLGHSYEAFLMADDNYSNELEEQYIEIFDQDNLIIEQEILNVSKANEAIATEVESLESFAAPSDSRQNMEQLCAELESFEQLHRQLLEHKETLQQRVTARTQELQKLEKQVSKNKFNIAALKKSVKSQNLSQDDIKRMKNEIACLRDTLDRTAASRTEIQKLACEHDESFQHKINDLKQQAKQFNAMTERCKQTLPYNYALKNKEVVIYVDSTQAQNYKTDPSKLFGGIHMQQYAIPKFMKMRDDFCDQIDVNKQMLVKLAGQKQSAEITIMDDSEKSKIASNELQSIQETMQREEKSFESELSSLLNEVRNIEDKIKSSAQPSTFAATIAKYQMQLTEKEHERRRQHNEAAAVKESINEEVKYALGITANHKEYIQSDIANLVTDLESRIDHLSLVQEDDSINDATGLLAKTRIR